MKKIIICIIALFLIFVSIAVYNMSIMELSSPFGSFHGFPSKKVIMLPSICW